MKKIYYLIAMAVTAFTFTSCEDVPEPFGQPINPNAGETVVVEPVGSGTEADPYNVAKVTEVTKAMADGEVKNDVYTKGYICQIDDIDTDPNGNKYGNSTYWISDDAEGKSGKYEVYRGYGLGGQKFCDTGATIIKVGDAVTVKGNIKNYKGTTPEYDSGSIIVELNGVKASGGGGGEGGGDTPTGGTVFEESFETGQGNFTIDNKTLGEGLTFVWKHDATNKYMKASAYSGGNKDAESWLISPEIDLTNTTKPVLTFSQVINKYFGTVADEAMVYVKKDGGEWTKVTITFPTTVPAANWSKFTDEGADQSVDITAFKSSKTQFAFVYKSSTTAAGTWEIKNAKISDGEGSGGGETPASGPYLNETFETSQGNFTIDNKTLGEGLTFVWKHDATNKYMKASAYSGGNKDAESWLISPEIDLTNTTKPVLTFSQVINKYFGTVADEAMVYVKKDGGEWTKVTITFPTTVPAANWSKFTDEGADQSVDITAFKSSKTQFAFVYKSSTTAAGTWEIKNIKVAEPAQ